MISVILKIIENFDLEPADLKTLLLAVAHILESHGITSTPSIWLILYKKEKKYLKGSKIQLILFYFP